MASPPESADVRRRWLVLGAALVAICCAAALLGTSPGLPMVWDEGDAILRAEAIPQKWQYTTQREGHPAFYGILIAVGGRISAGWREPLDAARFGPMMLFGLAAGAMFYRMGRDYSAAAAVGAVGALILLPRMFAHAHFASLDGPLTSCWILAWATFAPASRGASPRAPWQRAVFWGIALGMTLSCKATGWIAPLPFLAWTLIYRDRAAARTLAIGLPVALLTFFALNPPLWHDPLHGWVEFFDLNLHRAARFNIPVEFLGESHHLGSPLPWYNTMLWTAVTVPLGTLVLAAIGTLVVTRRCRTDRAGILLVANWLVLLIVRGLPMVPPHDGVRLFLPSFAFLAALAGLGCHEVLSWAQAAGGDRARGSLALFERFRKRWLVAAALGLIYAGSATSLYWYAPQWLSYYNLLIGGLPGAKKAGMEPTYYWDGLDRSVLDWLDENTEEDEQILFQSALLANLRLMQRWQILRRRATFEVIDRRHEGETEKSVWYLLEYRPRRVKVVDSMPESRWYVLQHRPGTWPWQPIDPWLIDNEEPAHRKTIRRPALRAALQSRGLDVPRPWRLDVPLVEVYDYRQYLRAREVTGGSDIGRENSP
ncbi:MAG: ArnT family glycosyltransferase [Planctomycetota bacterium]|jgi:hypothetical protein